MLYHTGYCYDMYHDKEPYYFTKLLLYVDTGRGYNPVILHLVQKQYINIVYCLLCIVYMHVKLLLN